MRHSLRHSLKAFLTAGMIGGNMLALLAIGAPEESVRAQSRGSGPPPSACGITLTETATLAPKVCEDATVTVTMQVTRPVALPLHVVFVVAKHLLMFDHLDEAKRAASDAAGALEFTNGTRAGVVSLSVQGKTEQELTENKSLVLSAISRLRLDQVNPTARYYDWLAEAEDLLARARSEAVSPVEIIVLVSTGCPIGFESYCSRQQASSSRVQGKGVTVIGICNPNAVIPPPALPASHCNDIRALASMGSYYDLRQASRAKQRLVELETAAKAVEPRIVQLIETLAPGFAFVPGSETIAPALLGAGFAQNAERLKWEWNAVPADAFLTATYKVKALAEGPAELRLEGSQATVEDNFGRVSDPLRLPARSLDVQPCVVETPTPSPTPTATITPSPEASPTPSATRTPPASPTASPSPSATASPTGEPGLVYLPALARRVCTQAVAHTDVVLLIDASTSMAEAAGPGSRLEAARDAARSFLDLLALEGEGDQAALLSFNNRAQVLTGLGDDRGRLEAALQAIALERGTRIDLAIEAATEVFGSDEARPGNNRVLILMTDGQPDGGTDADTIAAATRAGASGITLYAIGFGSGVSDDFLRQLTSRPENYLAAPSPEALRLVYASIAGELPCPGGVIWGR